jgi:phage/plasmid-like protein (TIGR03299 family)
MPFFNSGRTGATIMAHQIHENDSMLAVGKTPWHGLGTTLATPPATAAEALKLSGLDWTVAKRPMFLDDGQPVKVKTVYESARDRVSVPGAIVREDTNEILGVVGGQYLPYQNADMAELFDPLIQDGSVSIETCGSLFNGRRVWMLARFMSEHGSSMTIRDGDDVAKYLLLAHGHDGTLAVRFGFTPIRVVCNNTLSFALSDGKSSLVKCLHTANLARNLQILRDAMKMADSAFELTAEQYRSLAARGVSTASLREYARLVVGADEIASKRTAAESRKIGEIVGSAMDGRGNTGRTWWDAYNGVTEWLTWTQGRDAASRINSVWFGGGVATSTDALKLALEMSV